MLESPPPVIIAAPSIPPDFDLRNLKPVADRIALRGRCARPGDAEDEAAEIVVCGHRDDDRYRLKSPPPTRAIVMEEINDSLSVKIGSARIGSFTDSSGQRHFGLHIPF